MPNQILYIALRNSTLKSGPPCTAVVTVSRPTQLRGRGLPLLLAGVDFRLKIHIRFCRAYA